MFYLLLVFIAGGAVFLDQWTKALTVQRFAPYAAQYARHAAMGTPYRGVPAAEQVPAIPGLFHITFTGNQGGGWSVLSGQMWFFILITVVFLLLVVLAVWKKWLRSKGSLLALAAVTGGALGNFIDRIARGFVVDMIELEFMSFPVFNIADCFICCGAAALVVCVFLEDRKEKKA